MLHAQKYKFVKFVACLSMLVVSLLGIQVVSVAACGNGGATQSSAQACNDATDHAEQDLQNCNSDANQEACKTSVCQDMYDQYATIIGGCSDYVKTSKADSGDLGITCEQATGSSKYTCVDPAEQAAHTCTAHNGFECSEIYTKFINPLVRFLAIGVGVIVTIMIIIGGVQYATASGNPQAAAAARKRIFGAILALVVFALLYALLNWIVPGGVRMSP